MNQTITVFPLTPDRRSDFEVLFGPKGACAGCWCTYFRLGHKVWQDAKADERKAVMLERIVRGPPPGLIAYRAGKPVGWLQIGPRADIPEWNNAKRATTPLADAPADDATVWAMSCFFFAKNERGKGLSHRMVAEGVEFARKNGARLIEACPMDEANKAKSIALFVGSTRVFAKAGFREVARRKPGRPLMRLEL
ncbi:MAG: GNAT family N-acetyltransferase [Phyllobacteriaceae bacterium]|nr:GNAT family N-acetyltransferase [Phyllobacteriaceae bacterium]